MFTFWIAAVGGIAFISWLFLIVEFIGTHAFWPWIFRLGPLIWIEERPAPTLSFSVEDRFDTRSARFRLDPPDTWLFRKKFKLVGVSSAFKGSLEIRQGQLVARCRWPLGMAGFLGAWLVGWCSAGLAVRHQAQDQGIAAAAFVLAGVAFLLLMVTVSLKLERRIARRAIDEFVSHRKGQLAST